MADGDVPDMEYDAPVCAVYDESSVTAVRSEVDGLYGVGGAAVAPGAQPQSNQRRFEESAGPVGPSHAAFDDDDAASAECAEPATKSIVPSRKAA